MKVKLGEERTMKCCVDVSRQCAGTSCMGFLPCQLMEEKAVHPNEVEAYHNDGWRDRHEETKDGLTVMTKFFPGGKCGRIYGEN